MFRIDPDNAVLAALARYFDMVWVSLLWLITSLPLVTLGLSSTALWTVLLRLAENTLDGGVASSFFRVWREQWRQALPVGLGLLALLALIWADVTVCVKAAPAGPAAVVLWSGSILLAVCTACAALYAFPVLARFQVTARQLAHNVFILTIQHPLRTVGLLGLCLAALAAVWFLGFAGPILSGPALYLAAKTLSAEFRLYAARWADGAGGD